MAGCHVCGRGHGSDWYFRVCSPKYRYQVEMEQRAEEMRKFYGVAATPTPTAGDR